jgi:hypothetical protein
VITWIGIWIGTRGPPRLPSYLLHRASQSSPLTRYCLCNILYLSTVGFCSSVGYFSALPLYLARQVIRRQGTSPRTPIGNHQRVVDVFLLGTCVTSPVYLLHASDHADCRRAPDGDPSDAQKVTQYMPVFGQFQEAGGAVFVDRGNSAVAVQSLQAAGEEIKKHHTSI